MREAMRAGADLWSDYWADAPAPDCAGLLPATARAAISEIWRAAFAALPEGAAALDIASGRGAALCHAENARERGLRLTGVDLAETIPPRADAAYALIGGVDAARLPFADCAFDLTISQFGIEYAGLAPALAEAARVTKTRLLLLTHAAEGAMADDNAAEAAAARLLTGDIALFDRLADHCARATPESRRALDAAIESAAARSESKGGRIYREMAGAAAAIRARAGDPGAIAVIAEIRRRLDNHGARMDALARAAPTRAALAEAARRIGQDGFAIRLADARDPANGALIGYWLDAARI